MPRIVFINRFFYPDHSATSQLLSDLCFYLVKRGFDIHVVSSRQLYVNAHTDLPIEENAHGVKVHRVWTSRFGRGNLFFRAVDYLTFYLSAGSQLLRLVSPGDVIVAKTDPPLFSVIAYFIANLKRATLINWLQDLYPEVATALGVRGTRWVSGALRYLRNLSLKNAKSNVVLGQRMATLLEREGIDRNRLVTIHNWPVGDGITHIDAKHNELRLEWGLQGKFVVGYSGNMGRVHDFNTIIEAVKALNERDLDIIFLFVGGGAQHSVIEKELAGFPNTLFKPYQPLQRLSQSLSVPDVHLVSLLSEMEGMIVPSKFYGIAAAGRPAIFVGDPEGEIAHIICEEECGYVVPSGQADSLVECILEADRHRVENTLKGRNARDAFQRRFNRDIAMASWKSILCFAS